MESTEDFIARMERERKGRSDKLKQEVLQRLKKMKNIAVVTVKYDGYNDDGSIESIYAVDSASSPVDLDKELEDKIEELCYALLDVSRGGWEINEGSFGTFEIHVESGEIALTHNDRIEAYETSRDTF